MLTMRFIVDMHMRISQSTHEWCIPDTNVRASITHDNGISAGQK